MLCPACKVEMSQALNRQGKIIDFCETCQGMWLDKGELFCYCKKPSAIAQHLVNDLIGSKAGERICPRCDKAMEVGGFIKPELEIDRCKSCGGIWLDTGELNMVKELDLMGASAQAMNTPVRVLSSSRMGPDIGNAPVGGTVKSLPRVATGDALSEIEGQRKEAPSAAELAALPALPSLAFRAVLTLSFLYSILFAIMVIATEEFRLPPGASIGITAFILLIQYIISPWIMDFQLSWTNRCDWVSPERLPPHLKKFIAGVTAKNGMGFPSMGIIRDSTPNAFTYGRYPGDARIVITNGLIEKLTPEELESVVAHEIGHAVHWDMALMTLAAMVPIILYNIYKFGMEMVKSRGGGKKDGKAPVLAIAVAAYICYVISEYIVLFLSRTREYHADRFAAESCNNSASLASALIKVAYGLASDASAAQSESEEASTNVREGSTGRMMAPLGIFDVTAAKALVSSTAVVSGGGGPVNKERIKDAMQWDLWNPWGTYYELHSTHPLVANRLDQLGRMSFQFGHKPFIIFDRRQPESFWDEFFVDFAVLYTPLGLGALGAFLAYNFLRQDEVAAIGGFLTGIGAGSLIQMFFSYNFDFLTHTVASLLKQVKVSGVRAVPARIKGKIIGRGIPGYIFSEDMTFQDETGYIFVDYQQPLALMEWWFALAKDAYVGRDVILEGWYKRAPVPYFEVYCIKSHQGAVLESTYTYGARLFFNVLMIGGGIFLALMAG